MGGADMVALAEEILGRRGRLPRQLIFAGPTPSVSGGSCLRDCLKVGLWVVRVVVPDFDQQLLMVGQ
jgi:hypothetical protein